MVVSDCQHHIAQHVHRLQSILLYGDNKKERMLSGINVKTSRNKTTGTDVPKSTVSVRLFFNQILIEQCVLNVKSAVNFANQLFIFTTIYGREEI